jgi:hypothetical protein
VTTVPKLTRLSKVAKVANLALVKAKVTAAKVSFAKDIKPLFRPKDIACMNGNGIDLTSYNDVKANAANIYQQLSTFAMPLGGPHWTAAQLALFNSWMTQGYAP